MRQKNILGLEIAMDDLVAFQKYEATQQLLREAPDKLHGKPFEFVCLDKLVEIHPQKLSRDAQMAAEVEALHEMNHAMFALGIPFSQLLQYVNLDEGLLVEPLFVSYYLDGHQNARLVVYAAHDLPKAAFTEDIDDLITIS